MTALENLNSESAAAVSQFSDLTIELGPFDQEITENYIRHRLNCSGCSEPLFKADALREIQKLSGGIPEKINQICDLALLAGYEQNLQQIDSNVITRAGGEIKGAPLTTNRISEVVHSV